jgi:hypothetical protein
MKAGGKQLEIIWIAVKESFYFFFGTSNYFHYLHGADRFLGSRHFRTYSKISQHFIEHGGSLLCSQEPSCGPYPEPDQTSPYHPILSLQDLI